MEFFSDAVSPLRDADLHRHVRIDNLDKWCASIEKVRPHGGGKGEIECAWGKFSVRREVIRNGVRFTLPACPDALQWTVTAEAGGIVRVHCALNRMEPEEKLQLLLKRFVADWKAGLEAAAGLSGPRPVAQCTPWYG